MPRYTTRQVRSYDDAWTAEQWPLIADIRVSEREPARTGIVDKDGREYLRMPETIGFLAKD